MNLHNNKHNNINKQRSPLTTKNNSQERHGALIKFCDRSHSQQEDDRVFHVSRRFLPRTLATISWRFPVISFRFSNFYFLSIVVFLRFLSQFSTFFLTSLIVYLYFYSPVCISNHVISHNVFILVYFFYSFYYCSFLYHSRLPITTSINPIFIISILISVFLSINTFYLSVPVFFLSFFPKHLSIWLFP